MGKSSRRTWRRRARNWQRYSAAWRQPYADRFRRQGRFWDEVPTVQRLRQEATHGR